MYLALTIFKHFFILSTFFSFVLSVVSIPGYSQEKYTINGYIKDAADGEVLIGATVAVPDLSLGTSTNVYGFYSLTLPVGEYQLLYSYVGYQSESADITLNKNQTLNIELRSGNVQLQEVIVSDERPENNVQDVKMSREELNIEKVKTLPALFGEVDVMRIIQLLPGVQSAGEGTTGLFVRGGSADQNLVLLDEATVYNPSHFLGFFSVFNPDAIKNLELYKGGIPARYGSRLASILNIQMKEGNSKRLALTGGIGSISSRLTVEGPLKKDESSFILSGRRTYADVFLKLSSNEDINNNTLYFYDFNAKAIFNPVTDATVDITDDLTSAVYTLAPIENEAGVYRNTEIPMDSGRTYTLHIAYNGLEYEASGTLLPVAQVDSFTYRYQPKRSLLYEGYYLYFSGSTPKDRGINYYRFTIYKNDSLYNAPEDYLIRSDEFLKSKIDTLQLAKYAFDVGDTVKIEMFSLNKNIFEYYNELLELLFNDGGLFSSTPRNPTSNIRNLTEPARPPLGFFQVSTAFGRTVIIEEE